MSAINALRMEKGEPTIAMQDESDLQRGMAEYAELHGWRAQCETVIPGWGRLDLILHAAEYDDYAAVIEFKTKLVKPSLIRKAFQQADGYKRWLEMNNKYFGVVWLSANEIDEAAANDAAYAYRESVRLIHPGVIMNFISASHRVEDRVARARLVHERAIHRARIATRAHNQMLAHRHQTRLADAMRERVRIDESEHSQPHTTNERSPGPKSSLPVSNPNDSRSGT